MSDITPNDERTHDQADGSDTPRVEELPTEEVPAAAGGHDDTDPEQGEGRQDSH